MPGFNPGVKAALVPGFEQFRKQLTDLGIEIFYEDVPQPDGSIDHIGAHWTVTPHVGCGAQAATLDAAVIQLLEGLQLVARSHEKQIADQDAQIARLTSELAEVTEKWRAVINRIANGLKQSVGSIDNVRMVQFRVDEIEAMWAALSAPEPQTAEATRSASSQRCAWKEDIDGVFFTDCDEAFIFTEGMPDDNSVKFCAYCGKAILVVLYQAPTWNDDGESAPQSSVRPDAGVDDGPLGVHADELPIPPATRDGRQP